MLETDTFDIAPSDWNLMAFMQDVSVSNLQSVEYTPCFVAMPCNPRLMPSMKVALDMMSMSAKW